MTTQEPKPDKYYFDLGFRLVEICKAKKVNIEDMLTWIEENYGKKAQNKAQQSNIKEIPTDGKANNLFLERRKAKCGF